MHALDRVCCSSVPATLHTSELLLRMSRTIRRLQMIAERVAGCMPCLDFVLVWRRRQSDPALWPGNVDAGYVMRQQRLLGQLLT